MVVNSCISGFDGDIMTIPKNDHLKEIETLKLKYTNRIRKLLKAALAAVLVLCVLTVLSISFLFNQVANDIRDAQVGSCERGNVVRYILNSGNELEIEQATKEIQTLDQYPRKQQATTEFQDLRKAKVAARAERISRRVMLQPYPCDSLR